LGLRVIGRLWSGQSHVVGLAGGGLAGGGRHVTNEHLPGCNMATDLALYMPDLVARLILISPPTHLEGTLGVSLPARTQSLVATAVASFPIRRAAMLLARARSRGGGFVGALRSVVAGGGRWVDKDGKEGGNSDGMWGAGEEEALRVGAVSVMAPGHARATAAFVGSGGYRLAAAAVALRQSALVLAGGEDALLRRDEFAGRFVREIGPRGSLEVLQGAGHLPHWDAPEATAAALGAWLAAPAWECEACGNSEAVGCPNCDALGYYVAYSRRVTCSCCHGRGRVVCRACFRGDPWDIDGVRNRMRAIPD